MAEINTEAATIAALSSAADDPRSVAEGTIPFVTLHKDYAVHGLEHLFQAPQRKKGTTVVRDAASFCGLVREHQTDATKVYGCMEPPKFVAVLNDHWKEGPGWRDHRVEYACPLSVEWKTWTGSNKKAMAQADFAQFIEDNAPDIIEPASADMIEISRTLEAKKKVNFASGIRLSNGQQELTYEEQIQGTAAKGKLVVPEVFSIAIPVLEGGDRFRMRARLRYRISDQGALAMWFDLERPHKDLEAAVKDVWAAIETGAGVTVINGNA